MNEMFRKLLFLPEQASTISREVDVLHYIVITVTMAGALAVAFVVAVFLFRYRERALRGDNQEPDLRPGRRHAGIPFWIEGLVIGGLLSLFLAFWAAGFRQFVKLQSPPDGSLEIYVTGKQWMWSFAYPNGGGSNDVLYVPIGRPVKLLLTSRDVIHSFFVPAFRIKQDVVPGRMTAAWFQVDEPGLYEVFCTEYCGLDHSGMRAAVLALAPEEFDQRTRGVRIAGAGRELDLAAIGERVAAQRGCLRCHTVDGTPHIGPTWAGLYGSRVPLASGRSAVVDETYITESMMDPMNAVHAGFQPVMPSYLGQLSATETAAIVELIRALRERSPDVPTSPLPRVPREEPP